MGLLKAFPVRGLWRPGVVHLTEGHALTGPATFPRRSPPLHMDLLRNMPAWAYHHVDSPGQVSVGHRLSALEMAPTATIHAAVLDPLRCLPAVPHTAAVIALEQPLLVVQFRPMDLKAECLHRVG